MSKIIASLFLFIIFNNVLAQKPNADKTPPTVLSINRQTPNSQSTAASSVTFRVTFSEKVKKVDYTDFTLITVSGTATGTISKNTVTTVGSDGSTYDVTVSSITGNGEIRLDLNSSNTGITDATGNAISGGFTSGQTYIIGNTALTVLSINRQSPTTQTTSASSVTYRATFSKPVTGVDYTDFNATVVSGTLTSIISAVAVVGTDGSTYDVTVSSISGSGTLRLDLNATNTGIKDLSGNTISGGFTTGQTYIIDNTSTVDNTAPTVVSINRQSPATDITNANSVTYRTTFSEQVTGVDVSDFIVTVVSGSLTSAISGVTVVATNGTTYDITVSSISGSGTLRLDLKSTGTGITDAAGNAISGGFTSGQTYTIDNTVPTVQSINRQLPTSQSVNVSSVTFRAAFSEPVNGVDYTDFTVTTVSGTVTGILATNAVVAGSDGSTYDVTVSSITGSGTLRLDLKSSNTGITDAAGNAISGGYTSGETYIFSPPSGGFTTVTNLTPLPVSASTGEKPQAKVWTYSGRHWAVLANSTGTYLWRLDGTQWTSILKLSSRTTTKADCRIAGNVTHILLYQGPSSQFVSVEYDPSLNAYKLWSKRTATVGLTLDQGVETATIDMDGNGRMWLASAGVTQINVRWSDAPYTTWSDPVTIYDGVKDDDICANIYMPVQGKMAVFWSNQNTKRFGFKTHTDGADPSIWSADEVPASQSAIDNIGAGMADDHMNLALSSDGTLYCAVKTSYDTKGYPKISLLIRHPSGTWDNLYKISESGTRPIAVLNESLNKLRVVYSSIENGGDILYQETSIPNISFSSPMLLIKGGTYDNSTHSHQNSNSEVVILASDATTAVGVLASDGASTAPPVAPVLASPTDGSTVNATAPTLSWNTAAEALSYQVQVATRADFASTVFDQSNITATSVAVSGLTDGTLYYWRVKASNTAGSSDWSAVWSFTKAPVSAASLVGSWKMDEGSGTTLVDASSYGNNGTTVGNPQWTTGQVNQALLLNGSQYATVPNSASLNPTTAITLSAWIRPAAAASYATQNILKKSYTNHTTNVNGYELSLSNVGNVFFRINQATSADNYRLNSTTLYPKDGSTWMHIAATYDGTSIKVYINGVLNNSSSPASPPAIATNTLALGIGAQPDGQYKFTGAIDEARVYNRALSASEIAGLASLPPTLVTRAYGLNTAFVEESKETLMAYPNPFTTNTTIRFALARGGRYSVILFDSKGARVAVLKEGEAEVGVLNSVPLNSKGYSRGIYLVRLQTATGVKSIKLLLRGN